MPFASFKKQNTIKPEKERISKNRFQHKKKRLKDGFLNADM